MPVTANVYERVLKVTTSDGTLGTGFTLDFDDRQFLVSAEHVLPSSDPAEVTLSNRYGSWTRSLTRITGIKSGADIAVCSLTPPVTKTGHLPVIPSLDRIVYSQDVYFLGFPYGLALRLGETDLYPFVKKAAFSGSADSPDGVKTLFLDGWNNPGFSGGPVAFYDERSKAHICGVVSAYRVDLERVLSGDMEELNQFIRTNTGIIVAHDIRYAIDAIERSFRTERETE